LVAPVCVGAGARTGAGAVVTKDVPPDTLAVGMPARAIRKLK
jgi:bifunctional UDP-N-acetylglucosamine pyrophosphorylase/glucosamine-1-phosphate N-acetyltransferase